MNVCNHQDIRIGTLAGKNEKTAENIASLLPLGFESFQINFWKELYGTDMKALAVKVKDALVESDAVVSSLAIFGNPLVDDDDGRTCIEGWVQCIDTARDFGCDIVAGFAGRVPDVPIDQSMKKFKEVFTPLVKRAADRGVRIAFENCDMGGDWKRGTWNIAHNPAAWEMMFHEVPFDNVGLCWEPCHQMVSLIDPIPQLRRWVKKIFHVHGKDATVAWDVVREYGVDGPHPFAWHRTPGFGDTNWTDVISILRMNGFCGSIDIEGWHDPVYRDTLEMTGQVHALQYLKNCRGGAFVPNPIMS